ncbi:MAG: hypothetical protein PF517_18860 [Salinivirgaceae bacterium]|jgi:hypothetical protein|nr:hypothetical protein [Salinivirgaceae bacterium]
MARQQTDHLYKLIKSLTKAEKRNFKLYVKRIGNNENVKFLKLFNIIDKISEYNEEDILKKVPEIKPAQLPNLKANLSKNLLISLRLMAQQSDIEIMLRQQLDYAKILYNKALYRQSLITLGKAKLLAQKYHRELLYFEMIEFEKFIESQFITRSIDTKADELTDESQAINTRLTLSGSLSNLSIKLYGFYLKNGYARNPEDQINITEYFHENMPAFNFNQLGFMEKLYLYKSHVWYYLIIQDFLMVYRYSLKWVELFKENPDAIIAQPDLYIKGLSNMLDGLYLTGDYNRFNNVLKELGKVKNSPKIPMTKNVELLHYHHYYTHSINKHFMEGNFTKGVSIIPRIVEFLEKNEIYIDNHNILVFYYKIACMYFGSGDHKNTARYLNIVINYKDVELRSDIQCFSRMLNLITHFEMNNFELIEYLVKNTYRFLSKMKDLHRVQKEVLFFLRRLPATPPDKLNDAFKALLIKLKELQKDPFEKRPSLYLDIISWLESKISGVTVQEIIRAKRLKNGFEVD